MKVKYLFTGILFITALAFINTSASAQSLGGEKSLRGLKGVDIVVEEGDRFDGAEGLTAKIVRDVVAKKLSEGGVKVLTEAEDAPGDPYLHVDILIWKETDGSATISVLLQLRQEVTLERDPSIELSAITWMESQLMTAAKGELSNIVREKLGLMVDKFAAAYKEENQSTSARNSLSEELPAQPR